MEKKDLIENFLDNRSFRIPVEDLGIARNALGLLINSVKNDCANIAYSNIKDAKLGFIVKQAIREN